MQISKSTGWVTGIWQSCCIQIIIYNHHTRVDNTNGSVEAQQLGLTMCTGSVLSYKHSQLEDKSAEVYRCHVSPWGWWARPRSGSLVGWSASPPTWSHLLQKCHHAHMLVRPLPKGCFAMASVLCNLLPRYIQVREKDKENPSKEKRQNYNVWVFYLLRKICYLFYIVVW